MLSFLIDKCGSDASELPQLVRLNALLVDEDRGSATTNAKATNPAPKPAPSTIALTTNTGVGKAAPPQRDHSMLGFLLDRCATAEEQAQCPMLRQMRGWLLEEDGKERLENATEAAQLNVSPATQKACLAVREATQRNGSATQQPEQTPSGAAIRTSPMPPMPEIPVPILPGVGDWKGSITVHPPPTSMPSKQSIVKALPTAIAETESVPVEASTTSPPMPMAGVDGMEHGAQQVADEVRLPGPSEPYAHGEAALNTVSPSNEAAAHDGATAQPQVHSSPPYCAGRMPCPASEALAVRNSATVRLLAGVGVAGKSSSRPSSSLPSVTRPASAFAKRFMAGLYDRVSTPRTGAASAAIPLSQAPTLSHPIGSGVRVAREHHHQHVQQQQQPQQHYSPPPLDSRSIVHDRVRAEPWHAGASAGVRTGSASRRGLAAPPALSRRMPVPPAGPRPSRSATQARRTSAGGAAPSGTSSSLLLLPAVTSPSSAATRSSQAPSVAAQGLQARPASGCADPVGLMVVGARIRLPSAAPARSRYA